MISRHAQILCKLGSIVALFFMLEYIKQLTWFQWPINYYTGVYLKINTYALDLAIKLTAINTVAQFVGSGPVYPPAY
jgi:hypothetical protein